MRLILFLLVICVTCVGQTSGSLEVVIKDPSGALIHKAVVQLIKNGKVQSTAQTNQRGEAKFNKLAPGNYELLVEAAGFKPQTIAISTPLQRKEVSLEIDEIKVDVDVEEEAQVRNTNPNGASFSNVLTADQISQLPDDPEEF